MIYSTTSSGHVIAKIYRDLGNTIQIADWEQDAFEWIGEALEHIGAGVQLQKKEDSLTIASFKAALPVDLVQLHDVFYSPSVGADTETGYTVEAVVAGTAGNLILTIQGTVYSEAFDTDVPTTVSNWITSYAPSLSVLGITATADAETISLVADDLDVDLTVTDDSSGGDIIVTLTATDAVTTIGNATKYPLNRSGATLHAGVHTTTRGNSPAFVGESYILNPDYIHTSFETGYVFITYLAYPLDSNGYPLIPDNISYKEAAFWYIMKKLMMRGWKHPAGFDYGYGDAMWQKYCTQARNIANMPDIGQYDRFLNVWRNLVMPPSSRNEFFDSDDLRNPNWTYGLSEFE